eukprot:GHVO01066625.1.p1 GENE.GHVO01066625.1~~GHVO01066625.1.p1  ORF type:complete len:796 (+),score=140.74 GHVO01066625.1:196-2388(+)
MEALEMGQLTHEALRPRILPYYDIDDTEILPTPTSAVSLTPQTTPLRSGHGLSAKNTDRLSQNNVTPNRVPNACTPKTGGMIQVPKHEELKSEIVKTEELSPVVIPKNVTVKKLLEVLNNSKIGTQLTDEAMTMETEEETPAVPSVDDHKINNWIPPTDDNCCIADIEDMVSFGSSGKICRSSNICRRDSIASQFETNKQYDTDNSCDGDDNENTTPDETISPVMSQHIREAPKICCPYFVSRILARTSQIVFLTYTAILNPSIRKTCGLSIRDSIIIFDEAHNIEDTCRENGSHTLGYYNLRSIIRWLLNLRDKVGSTRMKASAASLGILCNSTLAIMIRIREKIDRHLESEIKSRDFKKASSVNWALGSPHIVCRWEPFAKELENAPVDVTHNAFFQDVLTSSDGDTFTKFLETLGSWLSTSSDITKKFRFQCWGFCEQLEDLNGAATLALKNEKEYSIALLLKPSAKQLQSSATVDEYGSHTELRICLLSADVVFTPLAKSARSVLLASGTLAPIEALISELGTEFHQRLSRPLSAPHVVDRDRFSVPILCTLATGLEIHSEMRAYCNAKNLRDPGFLTCLGWTLCILFDTIPDGVIVFLPSFDTIETMINIWSQKTGSMCIMDYMKEKKKHIIVEPRDSEEFERRRSQYVSAVIEEGGGVFLGVYRGKLSEGISLGDALSRGVVCIGLPYPNLGDHNITSKRKFNDAKRYGNRVQEIWDISRVMGV